MHEVIILDDVVDNETQDLIENAIFSPETQWTFGRTVFYHSHPEVTKENKNKILGFTKSLLRVEDQFAVDDFSLYAKPVEEAAKKLNQSVQKYLTSRIQLQLPVVKKRDPIPHVDGYRPFPYMVAIYYVNDSNGDTVLYKQTTDNCSPDDVKNGKLEIDQTIQYKKGRLVVFPGNIYHSAGRPSEDVRCIINYNFI